MEKPIRWNGFVEDRLDLGDVVVVGGLRYDYYDTRASGRSDRLAGHHVRIPARSRTMPGVRSDQPDLALREGQEPQLPEPARPGVVPGHRPDQLPAVLRPPGAGAGLRRCSCGGINTDLNITNTNHVYGSDLDFGKTITFEFGIRHAFSDDMVLDVAAYNKDIAVRSRPAAWSRCPTRPQARQRHPDPDQRRLRQHPRHRRAARPPVRQLLQRHAGLHLPAGQEHRLRSVHLHGLRLPDREPGRRRQPRRRRRRILPTDISRPHTLAFAAALTFPDDWKQGTASGAIFRERRRVRHRSATPAARRTPAASTRRRTACSSRSTPATSSVRQRDSPSGSTASRLPGVQGARRPASPRASASAGWT